MSLSHWLLQHSHLRVISSERSLRWGSSSVRYKLDDLAQITYICLPLVNLDDFTTFSSDINWFYWIILVLLAFTEFNQTWHKQCQRMVGSYVAKIELTELKQMAYQTRPSAYDYNDSGPPPLADDGIEHLRETERTGLGRTSWGHQSPLTPQQPLPVLDNGDGDYNEVAPLPVDYDSRNNGADFRYANLVLSLPMVSGNYSV